MRYSTVIFGLAFSLGCCRAADRGVALTPPMGWNSWDCYGTTVTEAEVKANADYMAKHLKPHGWQYVVVDIQWSEPNAKAHGYRPDAELAMDGYGRLIPRREPLPLVGGRTGFQSAGRLRSRPGTAIRHPHHARHPAAGGESQPAGGRQQGARRAKSPTATRSAPGTPTCTAWI